LISCFELTLTYHARTHAQSKEVCLSDCALLKHFAWQKHSQRDTLWTITKNLIDEELAQISSRDRLALVRHNVQRHIWLGRSDKQELTALIDKAAQLLPAPATPPPAQQSASAPVAVPVPVPAPAQAQVPAQKLDRDAAYAMARDRFVSSEIYQQFPPEEQHRLLGLFEESFADTVWDSWPDEQEIVNLLSQVWANI
jgi:hypothetical protein